MTLTTLPTRIKEDVLNELKGNKNTTVYFNNEDNFYVTSHAITPEQSSKPGHQVVLVVWDDEIK